MDSLIGFFRRRSVSSPVRICLSYSIPSLWRPKTPFLSLLHMFFPFLSLQPAVRPTILRSLALPDEIVLLVFRLLNSDVPKDVCSSFVLCQVCQHWRYLCLSTINNWNATGLSSLSTLSSSSIALDKKSLPVPLRLRCSLSSFCLLAPKLNSLREIDLEYIKSDDNQFSSLLRITRSSGNVSANLIRLCTPFGITKASLSGLDESIRYLPKLCHLRINGMWATADSIAKSLRSSLPQLTSLELGSALCPAAVDCLQFLVLAKSMPLLEHLRYDAPVRLDSFGTIQGNPSSLDFPSFVKSNYPKLVKLLSDADIPVWFKFWRILPSTVPVQIQKNPKLLTLTGESSLENLGDLTRVNELTIASPQQDTCINVLQRADLREIQILTVNSPVWLLQMNLLREYSKIQILRLETLIPVSEDEPALAALSDLPALETLVLRMREPWNNLSQLGLPETLTSLSLYGDQALTSLQNLASCPRLVALELLLNRELSGRDECHYLSSLTKLTHLSFKSGRLDPLQSSTELENPTLSIKTARAIASLALLRSLDLSGVTLYKGKIAAEIAKCSNLRRLVLNFSTVGQEALQALSPLRFYLSEVGMGFCSEINSLERGKDAALRFLQLLSRTICGRVETLDLRSSALRLADIVAGLRYNDFPLLSNLIVTDHHEFALPSKSAVAQFAQGIIETSYTLRYEIQKITVYRLSRTDAVIDHQNFGVIIRVSLDGSTQAAF